MARRLLVTTVLAVILFGGLVTIALTLPSVCPAATHVSGTVCTSNGRHPAPSAPSHMIPDYSTSRDSRTGLRVGIALMGAFLGVGLIWLGRRESGPSTPQPA